MFHIPQALLAAQADEPVLRAVVTRIKDPEQFLARVQFLYAHPEINSHEEILLEDGRTFDRYSGSLTDAAKRYLGRIWYFRDITGRKQAEEILHRQNLLLQAINESVGGCCPPPPWRRRSRSRSKGSGRLCAAIGWSSSRCAGIRTGAGGW
jgi:hypothetical protein